MHHAKGEAQIPKTKRHATNNTSLSRLVKKAVQQGRSE